MSDKRRNAQRTMFRKRCFFGISGPDYVGFTENISLTGLHLASNTPMPTGTQVTIAFGSDKSDLKIRVKGSIRWLIAPENDDVKERLNHMGVKITWHDENYLQFISDLIEQRRLTKEIQDDRRQAFRYDQKVVVIFESEDDILKQLTENISKGGLFVCTDRPLGKGIKVELRMVIPQLMEDVKVLGQVAFSVDLNAAKKLNKPPGMGIKFLQFNEGDREKFMEFLKKIATEHQKKQGA